MRFCGPALETCGYSQLAPLGTGGLSAAVSDCRVIQPKCAPFVGIRWHPKGHPNLRGTVLTFQILAVLALGLLCGSELNVAVFSHPTLNRHTQEVHIIVRSSFAQLFGRVMPFWMAGSTLLNLLLLLPFEHLDSSAWRLG